MLMHMRRLLPYLGADPCKTLRISYKNTTFVYRTKVVFFAGGGVGFKTEHRHRGMKLGIAPHSPDDWERQLAAGGDNKSRTYDLMHVKHAL